MNWDHRDNKKQKLLVLLDSQAILHRAYHALPDFTSPSGLPTGALYGFSAFLLKVLKEFKPDYVVACYDLAAPTFRHAAYEKYKAQRPKIDPNLIIQIDRSKDILRAFGIQIFELAGFEADDILGTIAQKTKSLKNLKTVISSGDLDLLQVVEGDRVVVYTLKKGISDTVIYNEENVKKRFGFAPPLIADFKALKGDLSDNIPGLQGIGEKTAQELLQKFGSLEEIYRNLEKNGAAADQRGETSLERAGIKKRAIEILKNNKEEAFFSRGLTEIRKDTPIEFDLNLFENKSRSSKKEVIKIFEELGFKSLISRLDEVNYFFNDSETASPKIANNSEILSPKNPNFKDELKNAKEFFWLSSDSEANLPSGKNLKVVCVLEDGGVFEFSKTDFEKEKAFFQELFQPRHPMSSGHRMSPKRHYAFKAKDLYHYFERFDLTPNFEFDSAIAVWLLDSEINNPSLDDIFRIAGVDIFVSTPAIESQELRREHNGKNLFEVRKRLLEKLEKENLLGVFYDIEMPLIKVLMGIENNGILIDNARFKNLSADCRQKLKKIKNKIWEIAGEEFNINSTKELRRVLFEKLKIETAGVRKTGGGVRSTKFSELVKIKNKHPIIQEIISFRELAKLKSTYIDSLPLLAKEDNRIRTIFNQTGTVTGRLSSSHPNLQNIPVKGELAKKIRESFIVKKGWKLAAFDYSQIELRITAHLSGDKKMKRAFEKNQDIHSLTASEIFNVSLEEVTSEMRRRAKVINFGILYGMGTRALSESLGITKKEAEIYRDEYFNDFQGVSAYIEKTIEEAREKGYVQTIFGRKRYFKETNPVSDMERREIERMAINMPIQGSAADIIKIAMVKIEEFLEKTPALKNKVNPVRSRPSKRDADAQTRQTSNGVKMILQIHDELLFEIKNEIVNEAVKIIKDIMENAYKNKISPHTKMFDARVKLPVEVHTGNNWGEL